MTIEIKNEWLSARVSEQGAELQSLVLLSSGEEYLWQGDPDVWSGRAPVLFPLVGMLRDNTLVHDGQSLSIPKHGLARQAEFNSQQDNDDCATFTLLSSEQTLKSFPWRFELRCEFSLHGHRLQVNYRVINRDDSEMIFTIGSHPAFALPLTDASLNDYAIEFAENETLDRYRLNDDGLLEDTGTAMLNNSNRIELSPHLFDDDALIFKNIKSRLIHLTHNNVKRLSVDTGGAPHLGIWAIPGAAFVCIEPWYGYNSAVSDAIEFEHKPSMQRLAPGDEFSTGIGIEIAT
jgi:galactose mutarotase-like enzyme